jgi:hypothetical protein
MINKPKHSGAKKGPRKQVQKMKKQHDPKQSKEMSKMGLLQKLGIRKKGEDDQASNAEPEPPVSNVDSTAGQYLREEITRQMNANPLAGCSTDDLAVLTDNAYVTVNHAMKRYSMEKVNEDGTAYDAEVEFTQLTAETDSIYTSAVTPFLDRYARQMEAEGRRIPYAVGSAILQRESELEGESKDGTGELPSYYGIVGAEALKDTIKNLTEENPANLEDLTAEVNLEPEPDNVVSLHGRNYNATPQQNSYAADDGSVDIQFEVA